MYQYWPLFTIVCTVISYSSPIIIVNKAVTASTHQSTTLHPTIATQVIETTTTALLTASNAPNSPTTSNLYFAILLPVMATVILILLIVIGVILPIACMIRRKMKLERKRLLTHSNNPLSSKPSFCKFYPHWKELIYNWLSHIYLHFILFNVYHYRYGKHY